MGGRVVSLTEALGSGAPTIASAVGGRLGIPVVDREVLLRAAQEAGVSPETIEEAERAPSFLARMAESLTVSEEVDEPMDPPEVFLNLSVVRNERYRELIERVIRGLADNSEAVIIGHGSHVILREHPNVLRVYLAAPLRVRAARISAARGIDLARAEDAVRTHDVARRNYFEQQYNVRRNEAQNYDLCLRTDKLTFETCTEIICLAVTRIAGA